MPDWSATLICPDEDFDGAPLLRHEFTVDPDHGPVSQATLHLTAHGVLTAYLNGQPVSDDVLTPGWSSYEWRLRYVSYDVTASHQADFGRWRRTRERLVPWPTGLWRRRARPVRGGPRCLRAAGDRVRRRACPDRGHRRLTGPPARRPSWPTTCTTDRPSTPAATPTPGSQPGFAGEGWTGVAPGELDLATLTPYIGPPVRRQEELAPVQIWTSPAGQDPGRLRPEPGRLDPGPGAGPRRAARSGCGTPRSSSTTSSASGRCALRRPPTDSSSVAARTSSSPALTFHGFRYAEVEGWPGELDALRAMPAALTAVVVHSELRRTGTFECSDELLNQLHRNVVWGTRGQLPRRADRLSAAGRATRLDRRHRGLRAVGGVPVRRRRVPPRLVARSGGRTGRGRRDGAVRGTRCAQVHGASHSTSHLPTAPRSGAMPRSGFRGRSGRPTATVRCWSDQFDSMAAHVRYVEQLLSPTGLWDTGFQFGDWLDPTAPPDKPLDAKADNGVVATACLYRSADLTAAGGRDPGPGGRRGRLRELADRTRTRVQRALRRGRRHHPQRCPDRVRAGHRLRHPRRPDLGRLAGERLAKLVADGGYPHPDRLRRHAVRRPTP